MRRPGPPVRKLLVLVILAGLSFPLYSSVYRPVAGWVWEMQGRLESEKRSLEELRRQAAAATVDDVQGRLAAARARQDELARRFPRTLDQPRLLEHLEQAAAAGGLTIQGISIGKAEPTGDYRRHPVEITVSGRFSAHAGFTRAIKEMPWLFRYEGFTLRSADTDEGIDDAAAAEPMPGRVEAVYRLSFYVDPSADPSAP